MTSRNLRFRTPGYVFGEAMSETAISINCPMRMKDSIKKMANKHEFSISRYVLGLIIKDLREHDKEFKDFHDSL